MRIRIKTKGKTMDLNSKNPKEIDTFNRKVITKDIEDKSQDKLIQYSPGIARSLLSKLDTAIEMETHRIGPQIARVLKTKQTSRAVPSGTSIKTLGFSQASLTSTINTGQIPRLSGMQYNGKVMWPLLSNSWMAHKSRHSTKGRNKFFIYKGGLLRWIERYKLSPVVNKLGGHQIMVHMADQPRGKKTLTSKEFVLGKIDINIFPNLRPSDLPMLSSRRWNSTSRKGSFERRYVANTGVREKLIGPSTVDQRPLLQPAIQFWLAFRYPRAIKRVVGNFIKANYNVR